MFGKTIRRVIGVQEPPRPAAEMPLGSLEDYLAEQRQQVGAFVVKAAKAVIASEACLVLATQEPRGSHVLACALVASVLYAGSQMLAAAYAEDYLHGQELSWLTHWSASLASDQQPSV